MVLKVLYFNRTLVANWLLLMAVLLTIQKKLQKDYLCNSRIKYFRHPNRRVSYARSKGVKFVTGDYLIFLDSDDRLCPDLLEELRRASFLDMI